MTPLEFERLYGFDERVCRGTLFPSAALPVEEGDRVGVVLLGAGGPAGPEGVEDALYRLYMDPVRTRLPVSGRPRHWLCKAMARARAESVRTKYDLIGGGAPMPRLAQEQAESLHRHLQDRYGGPTGVDFRTYVAMRYGPPLPEATAAKMQEEGVDKVVLVPLYPQYAKNTSGSVLAYWKALVEQDLIPAWPTTSITEYAVHPKYVQALLERMNEALQRFDRAAREEVHVLFSAHGALQSDKRDRGDPYCCLVHATVDQVVRRWTRERPFQVAFREVNGLGRALPPSTADALRAIGDRPGASVLVVPVSLVTDHLDISYTLDIRCRTDAHEAGIEQYEVATALNTHPLLIETLAEAAVAQLDLPVDVNQLRVGGNGVLPDYSLRPPEASPRIDPSRRTVCCGDQGCHAGARRWAVSEEAAEKGKESTADSPMT